MSFVEATRDWWARLAGQAFSRLQPSESLSLNLYAEDQTYLRFNQAKVRQATGVSQRNVGLAFQARGCAVQFAIDMTGQLDEDLALLDSLLERARAEVRCLPEDPYLVPVANHGCSDAAQPGDYPADGAWLDDIAATVCGVDFASLCCRGPQISAACNSAGQSHWFASDSFLMDYSLYTVNQAGDNKAVKGLHAGRVWQADSFRQAIAESRGQLERLRQPARRIPPGEYRVYLAPAALEKILQMFSWGAVSYDAWKKGQSGLQRLIEGKAQFADSFNLTENFALGLCPRFNRLGELAPESLPIIRQGRLENLLVSSRSAKEHGIPSNGSDSTGWLGEGLRSPEIGAGALPEAAALERLGHGLYLGNLHYLNWSDRQAGRITGMTRYACFCVENGEIVCPIHDLRFDESLYRIFGQGLEALTAETRLFPATDSYQQRALGGCQLPGALVAAFRFTL